MSRYQLLKTPSGFQYFLSLREIKNIEVEANLKFRSISSGAVTNAGHFNEEAYIQSSIRVLSISGWRTDEPWLFSFHQSGFRIGLIPLTMLEHVKTDVIEQSIAWLDKIRQSSATDGYLSPQVWVHVMIIEGKPKISFHELKK